MSLPCHMISLITFDDSWVVGLQIKLLKACAKSLQAAAASYHGSQIKIQPWEALKMLEPSRLALASPLLWAVLLWIGALRLDMHVC